MRALLALAALAALSQADAACIRKDGPEIQSLDELRDCQAKERQALIDRVFNKTGKTPSDAQLDALESRQQAEAQKFLSTHTEGASDMDLASGSQAPKSKPSRRKARQAPPPSDDEQSAEPREASQAAREAGMTDDDMKLLKANMLEQSDGGKKGVTPEMAAQMKAMIMQKQGSISPDMQDLLDSTSKDGANLSTETMQKLRNAGKAAKGQGMDLGIDKGVEKQLLEDDLGSKAGGTN